MHLAALLLIQQGLAMDPLPIAGVQFGTQYHPPYVLSGDICRMLFPTSRNTVRSFGAAMIDRWINFFCLDNAEVLGLNGDGTDREQLRLHPPVPWQLYCPPPKIMRPIGYNRIDTNERVDEGFCTDPEDDPDTSVGSNPEESVGSYSYESLTDTEETSTAESGSASFDSENIGCAGAQNVANDFAMMNRKYRGMYSEMTDWRLIGWVTDLTATTVLLPIRSVSWQERRLSNKQLLRNPVHYNKAAMAFDDIHLICITFSVV